MNLEIPAFDQVRILVAGDLMLDRYWSGTTTRVSPEAPVPVVKVDSKEERPGGAGNVALNIRALGAQCSLLAAVGQDAEADVVRSLLTDRGVASELLAFDGFKTITKLRVLSQHQQLIRLDFEENSLPDKQAIAEKFKQLLAAHDVVVLSDYGKATLSELPVLIRSAVDAGMPVLIDPKGRDFSPYRGASMITPNLKEFQAVVGDCVDETQIEERAHNLAQQLELDAVLITRGEKGMSLVPRAAAALHIPTEAQAVFDVTGAGDTVIAMLATALAAGATPEQAVRLSNIAASVTVAKLGAATVSVPELKQALHGQRDGHGVVEESTLLELVGAARDKGETIVMTNGCFDILHAGHVHYLNQAARLGDRLIVAVNVDETVRALKGNDRPVNTLESRMAVLAGLAAVDWVVAFSEETPQRLICEVKPDFLVKGGDNDPDKVPGADCVREHGGQVQALDFIEGKSTTSIIGRIKNH